MKLENTSRQPENPFAALIPDQRIAIVPSFTLESGDVLKNVPIAYTKRGTLSPQGDNALVICHALSGSADVADWWGPLMGGPGRAFDVTRFFIVCLNSLGSPYGSASPVTNVDGDLKRERYGPDFPLTTIRDDVNIHKAVLDDLGVQQIAAVVGGSLGGMLVLEYAYFGPAYVKTIVPIATSSRHSAWCIGWGEAQRQNIYCDSKYDDGYYSLEDPPSIGLGNARMAALMTYRSPDSFASRFGRNAPDPSRRKGNSASQRPTTPLNENWVIHNDGHKNAGSPRSVSGHGGNLSPPNTPPLKTPEANGNNLQFTDPQFNGATTFSPESPTKFSNNPKRASTSFSTHSYLRYQAEKFVKRFDPNCYIAITRKLDTHDVSRYRVTVDSANPIKEALAQIRQPTLVLGIESDRLFTFTEQQEIADAIPNSMLGKIDSPEGHDAFLLQFEQVNRYILDFFNGKLHKIMAGPGIATDGSDASGNQGVGKMERSSTFGEAEVGDMTEW